MASGAASGSAGRGDLGHKHVVSGQCQGLRGWGAEQDPAGTARW